MDRIPTHKIKWKIYAPFYIVFQVWKVRLIQICKIEPPDLLFLVVFISFYISTYHFSQFFRTSFNIICKKDFCREFSFLTYSPPTPSPNNQNPLSVTKVFGRCSLIKILFKCGEGLKLVLKHFEYSCYRLSEVTPWVSRVTTDDCVQTICNF